MITDDLLRRAATLDTCVLSDALDALGHPGAVTGLPPLWAGARAVGRAVTVRLEKGLPPPGAPRVHLGVRAIELGDASTVIVLDNAGRTEMGAWGGLLCTAAQARGISGVVIDGAARDADEARELAFAVFARATTSVTARDRIHEAEINAPITLGGQTVRPGDLVAADGSGVVVVAAEIGADVVAVAEKLAAREAQMLDRIRAGERASAVLGEQYESMLHARDPAAG